MVLTESLQALFGADGKGAYVAATCLMTVFVSMLYAFPSEDGIFTREYALLVDDDALFKCSFWCQLSAVAFSGLLFLAVSPLSSAMLDRVLNMGKNWQTHTLRSVVELTVWVRSMFKVLSMTESILAAIMVGTFAGAAIVTAGSRLSKEVDAMERVIFRLISGDSRRPSFSEELTSLKDPSDSITSIIADPKLVLCLVMCMCGSALHSSFGTTTSAVQQVALAVILWVFTNALFVSVGNLLSRAKFTSFVGEAVLDRVMNSYANWERHTFRSGLETLSYLLSILVAFIATQDIYQTGIAGAFSGIVVCSLTETYYGRARRPAWKKRHAIAVVGIACATALSAVTILAFSRNPVFSIAAVLLIALVGFFLNNAAVTTRDIVYTYVIIGALGWGASIMSTIVSCDLSSVGSSDIHPRVFPDMIYAACACALICGARVVALRYLLKPAAGWILQGRKEKKGWTDQEHLEKIAKCSTSLFKCGYMCMASIAGFSLLHNQSWAPAELGGAMISATEAGKAWGAIHLIGTLTPIIRAYYLVELGYAMHSLVFHLCIKRRNDFVEMIVHHIVTILLVAFSYLSGQYRVGIPVLLLHDLPDVFVYFTKSSVDSGSTVRTLAGYLGMVASWAYLRLYVFPLKVIYPVLAVTCLPENAGCAMPSCRWLGTNLVILQLLHVWWFLLFLKMGMTFLSKGKTVDLQSKTAYDEKIMKTGGGNLAKKAIKST